MCAKLHQYRPAAEAVRIGGCTPLGVDHSQRSICVGLHEHGALPIGRGGASVAKALQPLMHIKNEYPLVDSW